MEHQFCIILGEEIKNGTGFKAKIRLRAQIKLQSSLIIIRIAECFIQVKLITLRVEMFAGRNSQIFANFSWFRKIKYL